MGMKNTFFYTGSQPEATLFRLLTPLRGAMFLEPLYEFS